MCYTHSTVLLTIADCQGPLTFTSFHTAWHTALYNMEKDILLLYCNCITEDCRLPRSAYFHFRFIPPDILPYMTWKKIFCCLTLTQNFGPKQNLDPKTFLDPQKFFHPKKFLDPKKFWTSKKFGPQKNFWTLRNFWSQNNLDPKNFSTLNNFWTPKKI